MWQRVAHVRRNADAMMECLDRAIGDACLEQLTDQAMRLGVPVEMYLDVIVLAGPTALRFGGAIDELARCPTTASRCVPCPHAIRARRQARNPNWKSIEQGKSAMYITVRKYHFIRDAADVREAVMTGSVPILKASPGFQSHWTIDCTDGDIAAASMFDTEASAKAATDRTLAWVNEHIRTLVVLPPDAMFGGEG